MLELIKYPKDVYWSDGLGAMLKGFVSNRTKKKFSAYLVRGADGKVGFEFEQRAAKAPKAAPEKKATAEAKPAKTPKADSGATPKKKTATKKKA